MLVSTETCNNGTSVLVKDVESLFLKSTKIPQKLELVFHNVSLFILNVISKDTVSESVKILHSLISILKSNLSLFQME